MTKSDKVRDYIGNCLRNRNSIPDKVGCLTNGAVYLRSWQDMASKYGLSDIVTYVRALAEYDITLAKIVIGLNSPRFPHDLSMKLRKEAVSYHLDLSQHLNGPQKEASKGHSETLRRSRLQGVIENLSYLLFYEREGLCRMIDPVETCSESDTPEFKEEKKLHKGHKTGIARECMQFLSGFDSRLASRLQRETKLENTLDFLTHPRLCTGRIVEDWSSTGHKK